MKNLCLILLLFILSCLLFACNKPHKTQQPESKDSTITNAMVDSIFCVLDSEIIHKKEYIAKKELGLKQVKNTLLHSSSPSIQFELCCYLFEEYYSYQFDSAYVYVNKALELAHSDENAIQENKAMSLLLRCYASVGMLKEAYECMNKINPELLDVKVRADYYINCTLLYYNLITLAEGIDRLRDSYVNKIFELYDQALQLEGMDSAFYAKIKIDKKQLAGHPQEEIIALRKKLLATYDWSLREKAIAYINIGNLYRGLGDEVAAKYYIALSAICDARFCNNETMATRILAQMFYEENNYDDASRYIHAALDDATFFNSRLRKIEINTILSDIESSRWLTNSKQKFIAYCLVFTILLLLFLVIFMYIRLRYKNRQLSQTNEKYLENATLLDKANLELKSFNEKLQEADEIKNKCIMEAIYDNQNFVDIVQKFCRNVERKVKARQLDDVIYLVNNLNIKDENRRSLVMLDNIFLSIFPNFLEEFNKLLDKDGQVCLNENGTLPTEVRIYALQRMGINDTSLIAKYLCISQNTIYVYKAKLKAHALGDKEHFDEAVMKIPRPVLR